MASRVSVVGKKSTPSEMALGPRNWGQSAAELAMDWNKEAVRKNGIGSRKCFVMVQLMLKGASSFSLFHGSRIRPPVPSGQLRMPFKISFA